jgi:uncharacterized membrane protein (DUF4010 family)
VFNLALARQLVVPLVGLSIAAMLICALQYGFGGRRRRRRNANRSKIVELSGAGIFAAMFVVTSLLSTWVRPVWPYRHYSARCRFRVTDIDPFVLNLAQGGTSGIPNGAIAAAILIAASSNNLLKAGYATSFAGARELRR